MISPEIFICSINRCMLFLRRAEMGGGGGAPCMEDGEGKWGSDLGKHLLSLAPFHPAASSLLQSASSAPLTPRTEHLLAKCPSPRSPQCSHPALCLLLPCSLGGIVSSASCGLDAAGRPEGIRLLSFRDLFSFGKLPHPPSPHVLMPLGLCGQAGLLVQ